MSGLQHLRRLRARSRLLPHQLFSPRWRYTRLPNDIILHHKPLSALRPTLVSALRALRSAFLQAKYLIPIEAEAVHVWIM